MYANLHHLLTSLGIPSKPRYSPEETAEILGIRRDQVINLLQRGKLLGIRASERRWGGVIAGDLDDYLEEVNAPWVKKSQAPLAEEFRPSTPSPAPVPPPSTLPTRSVVAPTPPISSTPPNPNPPDAAPINQIPVVPAHTVKPDLGF